MKYAFSKTILAIATSVALLCGACGCASSGSRQDGEQTEKDCLTITATLFPQYSLACAVVGDLADVSQLLPPGTESHSFDPSMSDLMKLNESDLLIYTGDDMEKWASSFIAAADKELVVLNVSDGITLLSTKEEHTHDENEHDPHETHSHTDRNVDPHIWTSPKNAAHIARSICDTVCALDPENQEAYQRNTETLLEELSDLDAEFQTLADTADGKTLYFGGKFSLLYFVKEYGFSYVSLYDSCSESSEPSVRKMSEMIDAMKQEHAKVIFYPELTEPKAAQTIAESTDATPLLFHSCHNVSDREFSEGETYLSLMRKNLQNLREALS